MVLCLNGCNKEGKQTDNSMVKETNGVSATKDPIQDLSGKVVLTVNNQEISYDELRIYMQSNKEEIESIYGADVWSMSVNADGKSYEEMLKDALLDELIYTKLVCSQAQALGIGLTEDELLDVDELTAQFLSNFNEESLKYYSVNQDIVRQIYKDQMLANKVFESLTLNVDTQVTDDEARQAVLQYILVAKYGYDQEGNSFEYNEEQLAEAKERAEELYTLAQTTSDFYNFALANTDDEDEVEIIVGRGEMKKELEDVAMKLITGELSNVIETEDGYFIFYCVEEKNQEETDARKEEIIRERQEAAFAERYHEWYDSKQVTINQEIYNAISMVGEIVK